MPSYLIVSQDGNKNTVVLTADDGYSETQVYVGDATVLQAATVAFNEARLKSLVPADVVAVNTKVDVVDVGAAALLSKIGITKVAVADAPLDVVIK